jgi:hypothetical protein
LCGQLIAEKSTADALRKEKDLLLSSNEKFFEALRNEKSLLEAALENKTQLLVRCQMFPE